MMLYTGVQDFTGGPGSMYKFKLDAPDTDYCVIAFGYNNGVTSDPEMVTFHTLPAAAPEDCTFTYTVNEETTYGMTFTVTPSDATTYYYCDICIPSDYDEEGTIAEVEDGAIIVVENVTRVPSGNPNIYDDPTYVTNLLLRSWKNEVIYAGDVVIDRRKLTVILTCPPEDAEILERECGLCSYAWFRDFNKYMDELHQMAEETVTLEA
jgi:hypothetical protein